MVFVDADVVGRVMLQQGSILRQVPRRVELGHVMMMFWLWPFSGVKGGLLEVSRKAVSYRVNPCYCQCCAFILRFNTGGFEIPRCHACYLRMMFARFVWQGPAIANKAWWILS